MEIRDYRRRPAAIQVVTFDPDTRQEAQAIADWAGGEFHWWVMEPGAVDKWFVTAPDHLWRAHRGDLIVRSEDGSIKVVLARQADRFLADYVLWELGIARETGDQT